jgi:hypothetical protein
VNETDNRRRSPFSLGNKIAAWFARRKLYRERFVLAESRRRNQELRRDPIEEDPALQDAFEQSELLVQAEIANYRQRHGVCHRAWKVKKRVLRDQFGIVWFTPGEMNPGVRFD